MTTSLFSVGLIFASLIVSPHTAKAQDTSCQLSFDPKDPMFLTSDLYALLTSQDDVNCYAWQMFVALNWPVNNGWPANPALAGEPDRTATLSQWGVPSDPTKPLDTTTVWGSFKNPVDIFRPYAAKPTDWGVPTPKPSGCKASSADGLLSTAMPIHVLQSTSKDNDHDGHMKGTSLADDDGRLPFSIMQATGGWLTDQDKNLVYYEQKVGKAEFDYIVENGLYDAKTQRAVATNTVPGKDYPSGLDLPSGAALYTKPTKIQPQEDLGTFELKASWRILTSHPEQFSRYLTTTAWVKNPDTDDCMSEVIGLVGLHIIHKTATFPDFAWATFEQVDNAPDRRSANDPHLPFGYSFYNKDCQGPGDTCTVNAPRIDCDDTSETGDCKALFAKDVPVQVQRSLSIPPSVAQLNSDVQKQISDGTNGQSVFQYYELINVLWDQSPNLPTNAPGVNAQTPLFYSSFTSAGPKAVANTTMETYLQNQSCDFCHKGGHIAGDSDLAANFSFIFKDASTADIDFLQQTIKNDIQ
ncbi:hypothetical protein LPB41_12710 [Thalassospira sp. MA62]|nr:hypothetical protein [Thalassospira sp. MA62]